MTESFNWSGEQERRAALEEVTRLRREFDTTTAKGAKAFAKSAEAQEALARLDAAKSAVGMRTAAQDLAALNKVATSESGPTVRSGQGQVAATNVSKQDSNITKQLNQPSRQYFNQMNQAYNNPDVVPGIPSPKQVTPDLVQDYAKYGTDASKARFDWIWTEDPKTGKGRWGLGLVGLLKQKPADIEKAKPLDIFYSDSAPLAQAREIKKQTSWNSTFNNISLDELEQVIPEITFSALQEVYYQLTLERDEQITVEDIVKKYNELYREG